MIDTTIEYSFEGLTPQRRPAGQAESVASSASVQRRRIARDLELLQVRQQRERLRREQEARDLEMREEQLNLEHQLAEVMSSVRSRTSHGSHRGRNAARNVELAPTPALPAGSRARNSSAGPSRLAVPISMDVQQAEPVDVQRQVVHNVYHQTHVENQGVNPEVAAQAALQVGVALHKQPATPLQLPRQRHATKLNNVLR